MGDRANILIIDRPKVAEDDNEVSGIYLYTHWSGYEWPERLRLAMNLGTARGRWNDESYLTRILITELYEDLGKGATGGGISTLRCGGEYEVIIVDIPAQQVAFAEEGSEEDRNNWHGHLSFEDYCGQVEATWPGREN